MSDVATVTLPTGQSVRLGALPPDPARMRAKLWLHDYMAPAAPPPASCDYTPKAQAAISQVLGNDQYGDCVIASHLHLIGVYTGNATGTPAVATTSEAVEQYHAICGPFDRGCMMQDVLDAFKTRGLTAAGKVHRITDYVAVDWTNADLVKFAVYLFGGVSLAVNLPRSWESAKVWDVTNSGFAGGHGIPGVKYDDQGLTILTWGDTRLMTWPAVTSSRYVSEMYVPLSEDWMANAGLAPNGLKVEELAADLKKLADGQAPDITPTPPPWSWEDLA